MARRAEDARPASTADSRRCVSADQTKLRLSLKWLAGDGDGSVTALPANTNRKAPRIATLTQA